MTCNLLTTGSDAFLGGSGVLGQTAAVQDNRAIFMPVSGGLPGWQHVSSKYDHTLAIRNGIMYSWGSNGYVIGIPGGLGLLGRGPTGDNPDHVTAENLAEPHPVKIYQDSVIRDDWRVVATGELHSLALRDRKIYGWGSAAQGANGHGLGQPPTRWPVQIANVPQREWGYVAAGYHHSFAVTTTGELWTWGANASGQLGNGAASETVGVPVRVGVGETLWGDWVMVSGGLNHSAGIRADGTLWTWGGNFYGQLGLGTSGEDLQEVPAQVKGYGDALEGRKWVMVACGRNFTLALCAGVDGAPNELWTWGRGVDGQLGHSYGNLVTTPTLVEVASETGANPSGWLDIAAGDWHGMAVREEYGKRTLYAWGVNSVSLDSKGTQRSRLGLGPGSAEIVQTPTFVRREA